MSDETLSTISFEEPFGRYLQHSEAVREECVRTYPR